MSYIYDALKRAERDNQRRSATQLPRRNAEGSPARGTSWWLWITVGILGVNVVVLGAVVLAMWRRAPEPTVAKAPTPQVRAREEAAAVPAPRPAAPAAEKPVRTVEALGPPPSARTETPTVVATPPRTPGKAPPAGATPSPRSVAPSEPSARTVPPSAPAAPVAPGRVESGAPEEPSSPAAESSAPEAVPNSTAAGAPDIVLQVIAYSDVPSERMVFIGGRRYAEGDALNSETVLERIRPDSVVVKRQGRQFVIRDRRP